jgi:glycogen debranching enzyme
VNYSLEEIRKTNDMGHPLFDNLRAGNWLMDYVVGRLSNKPVNLDPIDNCIFFTTLTRLTRLYMRTAFELIKGLPRHLIPKYFDIVILKVFNAAATRATSQMTPFVANTPSWFVKSLAMGSVQLYGVVRGASMPCANGNRSELLPSLAAGLPYFSSGFMRCWGRDTFISLKGLFLVTGRFQEARQIILAFATCLRHGLIPNVSLLYFEYGNIISNTISFASSLWIIC